MSKFDLTQLFKGFDYLQEPSHFNKQLKQVVRDIYTAWLHGDIGDTRAFNAMQMLNHEILRHEAVNKETSK